MAEESGRECGSGGMTNVVKYDNTKLFAKIKIADI